MDNRYSISIFFALCLAVAKPLSCENQPTSVSLALSSSATVPLSRISSTNLHYPIVDGTDIRFSHPNAPSGLSMTKLGPIVQDNQGFLWFGSQHGLYRFDGYNFKVFVHDRANPTS